MTQDDLIFLGACLLVRDPDNQLCRRDSVAKEAVDQAIATSKFVWNLVQVEKLERAR